MSAKKKRPLRVRTTIQRGDCTLFASFPMRCPLCQIVVPANTPHRCVNPRIPEPR